MCMISPIDYGHFEIYFVARPRYNLSNLCFNIFKVVCLDECITWWRYYQDYGMWVQVYICDSLLIVLLAWNAHEWILCFG